MSSCRWVLADSASRMSCSTLPIVVSPATAVTSMSIWPVRFVVPAYTSRPTWASTGTASPVSEAWLMSLEPAAMRPSTGRFSPGRTRTVWPTRIDDSGTSRSSPSATSRAVSGVKSMRSRIARWAPQAVRLRIRFAVHRNRARNPAAR